VEDSGLIEVTHLASLGLKKRETAFWVLFFDDEGRLFYLRENYKEILLFRQELTCK